MKNDRFHLKYLLALWLLLALSAQADAPKFSINFENTDLRSALQLIATQSGLKLSAPDDLQGTVSYSFSNISLEQALQQIAQEKDFSYKILDNGVLSVSRGWSGGPTRGTATGGGAGTPRLLKLKYLTTLDALERLTPILSKDDKIIEDRPSNSLAFIGSNKTFENIIETLNLFDLMPRQVYIEAHIVELNKNKSLEFGFSYGDLGDPRLSSVGSSSAVVNNPGPGTANLAIQLGIGHIDGTTLSARLAAAEVQGEAKVLSRPKIVTVNNKPATISSGITFSVRTLAAVSVGGSGESGSGGVTAGITQVNAGLSLSVTPTIVGTDRIKLLINVTNSEPDLSSTVDDIPGVINNNTNTEIIVGNGNTASVAGLVKNSFSKGQSGVPFLSRIPLLGWLFRATSDANRDKELMIFITPRIVEQNYQEQSFDEMKIKNPEVFKSGKQSARTQ